MFIYSKLLIFLISSVTAYCAVKQKRNPLVWFFLGWWLHLWALGLLAILPLLKTIVLRALIKSRGTSPLYGFNRQAKEQDEIVTLEVEPSFSLKTTPEAMQKLWYFLDKEKQTIGPMSFQAFHQKWKNGAIFSETLVWNETFQDWKPFKDVFPN